MRWCSMRLRRVRVHAILPFRQAMEPALLLTPTRKIRRLAGSGRRTALASRRLDSGWECWGRNSICRIVDRRVERCGGIRQALGTGIVRQAARCVPGYPGQVADEAGWAGRTAAAWAPLDGDYLGEYLVDGRIAQEMDRMWTTALHSAPPGPPAVIRSGVGRPLSLRSGSMDTRIRGQEIHNATVTSRTAFAAVVSPKVRRLQRASDGQFLAGLAR